MHFLLQLIFILLFFGNVTSQTEVDQALVDYYMELIQNRTEASRNYQSPTDAGMYKPQNTTIEEYGSFDFIIVGAGATGCIIANRLSEVEEWSVLLLEAGIHPDGNLTRIPALNGLDVQSKYNWGYQSIPQKYACLGNSDARCPLPRGKGIGGSTLINGMVYARGNKNDYDRWADLLNDTSYSYENLLPYFLKTENFTQTNYFTPIDWKYHGTKGRLHMTQSNYSSDIFTATLEGSEQLGYGFSDYNGQQQLGTGATQMYLKNGFRDDPGLAFITSVKHRKNLKVLDQSYVIKLDINEDTKKINGVIFTRNNKTYVARNDKEVILSAGSIGSSQILILSGIGPKAHLDSLGVSTIANLPVGEILHDHPLTSMIFSSNSSIPNQVTEDTVKELIQGRGPLTTSTLNSLSWLTTQKQTPGSTPDMELFFLNPFQAYPDIPNPFTAYFSLTYPKSKGTFRLKSKDPYEYPLIDLNHLSDDEDLEMLYQVLTIVLQLIESEPFRRLNVTLASTSVEECTGLESLSKEFWVCYLRRSTSSAHHLISTCLTGTNSTNGVVDKHLKVFGVKDLRVADASVVPFSFANHPTATCAVIAEKISDQIKREHYKCT